MWRNIIKKHHDEDNKCPAAPRRSGSAFPLLGRRPHEYGGGNHNYQSPAEDYPGVAIMSDDDELNCPKCGSQHVHAEKRGFNMKRGLALGLTIAPGVGLLGGFIGGSKIWLTCLKCGYRFRPGETKKVAEVHAAFEVGSRVTRTLHGAVGEVTAIDGEAVTVRWPNNQIKIHLGRDLQEIKPLIPKPAGGPEPYTIRNQVMHKHRGVGEVMAVDGEVLTVKFSDGKISNHLRGDLSPM
jgi:hypothetical protein